MLRFLAIGLLALVLSLLAIFALALFPLGLYGGVLTGRSSTTGLCDKPWAQEAQLGLCLASAWLRGEQGNSPGTSGAELSTTQPQPASSDGALDGALATTRHPSPEAGSLPGAGQAGGIGAKAAFLVGPLAKNEWPGLGQDAGEGDDASHGGEGHATYAPYTSSELRDSPYWLREKDLVKIQKPLRWLKEGGGLESRDGASETNTPLPLTPPASSSDVSLDKVSKSTTTAGVGPETDGVDEASIINDLEDSRQGHGGAPNPGGGRQPQGKKRRTITSPPSHSSISSVDSDDSPTEVEKILARKLDAQSPSGGGNKQ